MLFTDSDTQGKSRGAWNAESLAYHFAMECKGGNPAKDLVYLSSL